MLTIEQIKEKLNDRKLIVVSDVTGIHYNTLLRIRNGDFKDIRHDTYLKLNAYFSDDSSDKNMKKKDVKNV